jgi:hypothetical protein
VRSEFGNKSRIEMKILQQKRKIIIIKTMRVSFPKLHTKKSTHRIVPRTGTPK